MYYMSGWIITLCIAYYRLDRAWCLLKPLPDELSSRLSLAKCVGEASDRFFQEGEILLVSLPIQEVSKFQASAVLLDRLIFTELFNRTHLSIVIKKTTTSRKNENYEKAVDNYVIQVRNLSELKANLNILQGYASWNPHAKFVIVSVTLYGNNTAAAATLIKQLWDEKIVNGIVLLPNNQNTSIFEAFSWFPFSQGHCGNGFDELVVVDRCSFGQFDVGDNWFVNKIPHDLNGCPIRVRTVVWPPYVLLPKNKVLGATNEYIFHDGLEIRLMNTMAEMANFSLVYTMSDLVQDWGSTSTDGTASGAMLYLKNEEADIAISSFASSVETHRYYDTITYSIPESLQWCVPHAAHIPLWKNFLVIISAETWVLLLVVYVVMSFCIWGLGLFEPKESLSYKSLLTCMQNIFSTMVNTSVKVQPKSTAVRLLFVIWIFFSLHLDVDYQTSLMGVFAKPKYEPQVSTVTDIFENKLKLWVLSTTERYFTNNDDWVSEKVLENWQHCDDIRECLYKTAFNRNSATCTPRLYRKFVINSYVSLNQEPLLYCFKDSVVTYPLEMLLRKGYPLTAYLTSLTSRITSSGLTAHWEKQILDNELKNSTDSSSAGNQNKHLQISVTHLTLLFAQLALGYTLGFITLLFEIYIYRRNLK